LAGASVFASPKILGCKQSTALLYSRHGVLVERLDFLIRSAYGLALVSGLGE
jgi:hypothetical protein